ncbi:hypothetical protein HGG82_04395 [Marinomonas sp. M1K-6]|uniref:Type I restriction modification DNA specificity domain-containing protein n=1 Tax=Marinomonas profundi TaxID=2726122 RepID=A0A847R9E4_9GAMM|nr:restriction endonuclease subunit S [Marinomonas profundi]NLQ16860.1 hypothetical protein [Marinomonas profundi]UDV02591.1 restriction endonuclease subunit S [Marinomonas profundi]
MSDIMQAEMKKKAQKWPMVSIKSVSTVVTGKTPSKKEADNFGGDIPFVTPVELGKEPYVYSSSQTITKKGAKAIKLVPKNSVLVCCIGSLGKTAIAGCEVGTNQQINSVIFDESKVFPKYGYYALNRLKSLMVSLAPSTTVAIINKSNFEALEIPLPLLEEQKRIAAILDKADAIRRKRQQAIKLADDFLRSVFLDMFGDPVTNPKGWEVTLLGNVVESQLGKMLSQKAKVGNSPKKYLRNANVRWRRFDLHNLLKMDFDSREMKKFKLKNGDILVCEGGDVGRCSIWRDNVSDCYYQKALHRIRPDLKVLTPEYVQEYFYWMSNRGGLSDSVSEVTFSHLTAEKLKELRIPIPPVALQNKFSVLYKSFELLVSKNELALQIVDEKFNSISQKTFSDEL